jgi:hypothetical protein
MKWHWGRFSPNTSVSPGNSLPPMVHIHLLSGADTIAPFSGSSVATGLSVTAHNPKYLDVRQRNAKISESKAEG